MRWADVLAALARRRSSRRPCSTQCPAHRARTRTAHADLFGSNWLSIMVTGFFVGTIVGLTGMGGGALMTPALIFLGVQPLDRGGQRPGRRQRLQVRSARPCTGARAHPTCGSPAG